MNANGKLAFLNCFKPTTFSYFITGETWTKNIWKNKTFKSLDNLFMSTTSNLIKNIFEQMVCFGYFSVHNPQQAVRKKVSK